MTGRHASRSALASGLLLALGGLLWSHGASAQDGDIDTLKSAAKPYEDECKPLKDTVDDDNPLWQHRWCPIVATVDGKRYVARHDFFRSAGGATYKYYGTSDWYNCQEKKDGKPLIPPVTYGIQCN